MGQSPESSINELKELKSEQIACLKKNYTNKYQIIQRDNLLPHFGRTQ